MDRKSNAGAIAGPIAGPPPAASPAQRSIVTNHPMRLPGTDMRTSMARRWKDLIRALTDDLGGKPSTSEIALIRQAAGLIIRCEAIQGDVVRGAAVDDEEHVRLSNAAQRILETLGLQRKREEAENRERLAAFQEARRIRREQS